MNTAPSLNNLRRRLAAAEHQRSLLLRTGRYLESMRKNQEIEELRQAIEHEEKFYTPRPLAEIITDVDKRIEIVRMLLELHLAADFVVDCVCGVKDWLNSEGLADISISRELADMKAVHERFASGLCKINDALCALMTDNDTLIEALHKKTLSYIDSRAEKKRKSRRKTK